MKRMRTLALISGFVALAFPALANAQSATGGDKYGGATVGEDLGTPGTMKKASPAETDPTGTETSADPVMPEETTDTSATDTDATTPPADVDVNVYSVEEPPAAVATPVVVDNDVQVVEAQDARVRTRMGLAISAGGGVTNFTDQDTQNVTSVGGAWDARLALGTRSMIGFEAAYVGSAADMSSLGGNLDSDAVLLGNGVEGLARLNLGTFDVQPYVVGGAGWTHYSIANDDFNTSSVANSDDVLAVPVGGGLSTYIGPGVLVDARFTYRWTFEEDMMGTDALGDRNDLDNWAATGRVGFEF